jgi:RNA polymerase sigma-70 factor (ECF subfamily)
VRRAQLGSSAAFEELVVRNGPRLHRYISLQLRHEADAHDAFQETLTAAWRGLPGLRQTDRFWPWMIGIAAHKAADTARHRTRACSIDELAQPRPHEGLFEAQEALASLSAQFRQVLLLRYLLGLTEEEAATALGVRVGTVKSRTARARRALLEAFQ